MTSTSAHSNGKKPSISGSFITNHRIKDMRDVNEQGKDKECSFRPEVSTHAEQDTSEVEVTEIKGIDKFLARQKAANQAKKEKEKYKLRGPMQTSERRNKTPNDLRRGRQNDMRDLRLSNKAACNNSYEKAKRQIHKDIQNILV